MNKEDKEKILKWAKESQKTLNAKNDECIFSYECIEQMLDEFTIEKKSPLDALFG